MILTERLFLIGMELKSAPQRSVELAVALSELAKTEDYSTWAGSLGQARPFPVREGRHVKVLEASGLMADGHLLVRVNHMHGHVFVTDGVWVDQRWRVFPFCDESQVLLAHAAAYVGWPDWTLDLATGCGHNMLGLDGAERRIGLDVNPRALAFAVVNRELNGIAADRQFLMINDIRDGVPGCLASGLGGRALVLANMPFGLAPDRDTLPLTSNGGASGANLQVATFHAVRNLAAKLPALTIRACLMGLTVGNRAADRWEVVDEARECFGADRVRWIHLEREKLFRVNGVRELDNPTPLKVALPRIAECALYVEDADRARQRAAYKRLAHHHEQMGNPDVAYGIIDVRLNTQ